MIVKLPKQYKQKSRIIQQDLAAFYVIYLKLTGEVAEGVTATIHSNKLQINSI